jgi:glycosyltransferase involved in cell wall biosynthesis
MLSSSPATAPFPSLPQTNQLLTIFVPSMVGGGAERVALNLATALSQEGWTVHLLVQQADGVFFNELPRNIQVVNLNSHSFFTNLLKIIQYLRQAKPLILHSMLDTWNVAGLAQQIARTETKIIPSFHNMLSVDLGLNGSKKSKIKTIAQRFVYRFCDGIVAVSRGVADEAITILRCPQRKMKVIYNPVVDAAVIARKANMPIDHPWFYPNQPPVIMGIGRLIPQKDFPTLLRAFALLHQDRRSRLMILGEGYLKLELEALVHELDIQEDVAFMGFQTNPYGYLAKAKLFVLSSAWEGFGNVVAEALAVGTPVVSTDCPSGPAEILQAGAYGELVPVGNPEAMAQAMNKMLNYSVDAEELRQRANNFSVEGSVAAYHHLFISTLLPH